jgi:hypothetical protein
MDPVGLRPDQAVRDAWTGSLAMAPTYLVVRRVAKSGVEVEAWAAMNGRKTMFWSGELAFDPDGKAVLPFWSHQLALTRQDRTVKAVFTPNGAGRGWMEAPWRQ